MHQVGLQENFCLRLADAVRIERLDLVEIGVTAQETAVDPNGVTPSDRPDAYRVHVRINIAGRNTRNSLSLFDELNGLRVDSARLSHDFLTIQFFHSPAG